MLSKREFMGVLIDETPDTLGDRILTSSGLRAEDALKSRYAANGHLDARVNRPRNKDREDGSHSRSVLVYPLWSLGPWMRVHRSGWTD